MTDNPITYFDEPGQANTPAVVEKIRKRIDSGGVSRVVVASNSGETALAIRDALEGSGAHVVCVTEHSGFDGGDEIRLKDEYAEKLRVRGVPVLICSHALSGVGRSISKKFGGVTPVEVIAYTLRLFGQGTKVAVEVAVMAADAGLVPTDEDVLAVGGSSRGADTALVLRPAHMNNFFDMRIREILCKPREF